MSSSVPTKIISGGQTGADMGGLLAARDLGIPTGGVAPKGYRTERGPQPLLKDLGLTESPYDSYNGRTADNVMAADGTAIFGNLHSPGSALTLKLCRQAGKPYIENPTVQELRTFIMTEQVKILNIAGNRESKNPGIEAGVQALLVEAFSVPQTEAISTSNEVSTSPAPSQPPDSPSVEPRSSRFTDLYVGGYSSAKFGIMLVNDGDGGYYAALSDTRQPNVHVLFDTVEELRTAVMLQQAMLESWERKQ